MTKRYFFAGNNYEGCGHRHRTKSAALKCLPRIDTKHGRPQVFKSVTKYVSVSKLVPGYSGPIATRTVTAV